MSQSVAEPPRVPETGPTHNFHRSSDPVESEFSYRPVPMSAVIGGVLAVLSLTALLAWLAIPVAVVAALICLAATIAILRSKGELAGLWMAVGGLALSTVMAVAGVLLTIHRYKTEIPTGFERHSFSRDISAKGIGYQEVEGKLKLDIPKSVRDLVGKPIYLKGFMYPQGRPNYLTTFVLCKDNAQCCFGGEPPLQDMIGVLLDEGLTTDYTDSLVGVAGKLKLNPNYRGGKLDPVYILEAEHVARALTSL